MVEDASKRVDDPALLWKILGDYAATVVGPEHQVELIFSRKPTLSTQTYLATVNAVITAQDILSRDLDGVILAGSIDPGLDEIRSSTLTPVVGITEAAVAMAGFVGRRAGIITVKGTHDPFSFARIIEEIVHKYGCGDRLIRHHPVRPIRESWADGYRAYVEAMNGDGASFLKSFDETAREMIADGADVIISGNQLFGPLLHHLGRRSLTPEGVPVVCNVAAALKSVQTLAELKTSVGLVKSNLGVFHPPPAGALAAVASTLKG